MKIKLSPFAEQDLDTSIEWYNLKRDGLGKEFAIDVSKIFERIKENSLQFPKKYKEMRKATIKRFPYIIFFVISDDIAFILGIFNTYRNPEIIRQRSRDSK